MKSFNYILACLSCSAILFSCTKEEVSNTSNDDIQRLNLNVTTAAYDTDENSRAINDAYVTKFAQNDAIGVFAVKSDGTIVENINNRKFTYIDGIWELEGDVIEYKGTEFRKFTFYAYYPYTENPKFEPTEEDPFATMVSKWEVGADQSNENYTKYDLMTSSASAEGERLQGKVSFVMNHRMGLAVIKMPSLTYAFTDPTISDYVIPGITPKTINYAGEEGSAYYDASTQTYMMLVEPNKSTTISGTYEGAKEMSFTFDANLEGGCATMFSINDNNKITHELAVGDYFCADGKLVSGSSETVPENCIGIVCSVGNPQVHVTHPDMYTETNDALFRDYPEAKHGLVLALNDSKGTTSQFSGKGLFSTWFTSDEDWADKFVGCNTGNSTSPIDMYPGYLGYNNTVLLTMCYESGTTTPCDRAYDYITTYRNEVKVPVSASAWYLPNLAELDLVYSNMSAINKKIKSVGGTELASTPAGQLTGFYWSSNERNDSYMWLHHMDGGTEFLQRERGSRAGYFRLMLAF